MKQSPKILLIEDDEPLAAALKRVLQGEGYRVELAADTVTGLARARDDVFDVVVTDLQLPGAVPLDIKAGLDLIEQIHAGKPQLPIILMTAHHSTATAIEATKLGAYDYLLKPFDPAELLDMIDKAVASSRLVSEPVGLGDTTSTADAIIGNSRAMQTVYKEIGRLADKPVTVLIRGETGTGKELVARALYQHSDRATQPFIVVNCVAIPETLLESDLFGHEQGAFTGAHTRRIGRFEQANRGTIFLDEIGDMSMSTQAKLLRVLQEKTIQRLGGKEFIPVDVRILAATHRDLEAAIHQNQFREDLYYRLNVAVITLPPLRDRRDDIPALIHYFLQRYGAELGSPNPSMTSDAIQFLQQQAWAGNVRELENAVRKALLLARGYAIGLENIHNALAQTKPLHAGADQTLPAFISDLLQRAARGELENIHGIFTAAAERELYAQAIELAQGNQAKVAKWLGVSRPTVREKLTLYCLFPKREADSSGKTRASEL
jgi:DNA-binding NtrC family response regulator